MQKQTSIIIAATVGVIVGTAVLPSIAGIGPSGYPTSGNPYVTASPTESYPVDTEPTEEPVEETPVEPEPTQAPLDTNAIDAIQAINDASIKYQVAQVWDDRAWDDTDVRQLMYDIATANNPNSVWVQRMQTKVDTYNANYEAQTDEINVLLEGYGEELDTTGWSPARLKSEIAKAKLVRARIEGKLVAEIANAESHVTLYQERVERTADVPMRSQFYQEKLNQYIDELQNLKSARDLLASSHDAF
ncbi:MAG: hypothetical protein RLZ71_471 [Actinomycetota bacterium]|jgi:hypothetical protein